ncbi:MAG TPA: hypothetical protein PLS67_05425 [Accumulibacter sp.]|nr:hypothetical protein [Accumulibacter sp.]HQC79947.1 hypothetical protein [Accumulibacter sp.]
MPSCRRRRAFPPARLGRALRHGAAGEREQALALLTRALDDARRRKLPEAGRIVDILRRIRGSAV